ncbi:MAG: hypothetical protein GY839_17605 [candidate division Zixibacteria bacterium]|nr:hypothetical protein [candidate division Zixibacteria bacterium]
MAGLYLTDDLSDPLKWAFPDTFIAAYGYLLVWADEGVGDPGLHTNFRLSDSGEQIGFFDIDAGGNGVIDSLTYGDQYNDTSYGRCPDGTENWMLFDSPTPETANTCNADYQYLPGDANMFNGQWPPQVIGGDVTYLVNYFRGMETNVPCFLDGFWASGDANGDCLVIGSDVTKLVSYFRGITELNNCPDFEPAWPTPDDPPGEAPPDWPNCE